MRSQTEKMLHPDEVVVGSMLGLGKESGLAFLMLLLSALGVACLLVMTDGNIYVAAAFVAGMATLLLTIYRVDVGLMLLIGAVLLFDQFHIPGFEPFTLKAMYFRNLKEIPYLPSFSAGVVNPIEVHLLLLFFVWFIVSAVRGEFQFAKVLFSWGAAIFFLGIVGFLIYGLRNEGDFLVALWEVRALFYCGIIYFFVPQVIRTKEQLHLLMWVCMAAITFKALQGIARLAANGFSLGGFATMTNHEDPLFILSLIVFLFALVLYNAQTPQRWALVILLLPLLLGFITGQRRAVYAAVVPAIATLVALLQSKERWMFMKTFMPIVVVGILYVAVFWESDSRLASPVKLVKTGLSLNPEEAGDRFYSNLYREVEEYDLARTIQRVPLFGVGFGNKYDQPIPLVTIRFPLRDYIPHNEILWIVVKTGALGFFLFWFFFNGFAVHATHTLLQSRDPYLKAICAVAIVMIIGQVVVSFFDLQLTYYRNMVYLGTLMGAVSSVNLINKETAQPRAAQNSE